MAEHPPGVAGRQPLRSGRGDGLGGGARRGLHFWPCRQYRARRPGGGSRGQSALLSCAEPQAEAAHLCAVSCTQAGSWRRPRKIVARLECSLQPVAGSTDMRQEVDIRYVVTSLKGSARRSLRDRLLPARADGEPDQAAQGAAGVGSHVVSQRDRQSGTASPPHCRVLADAWRARRHPERKPARQMRVRDHP